MKEVYGPKVIEHFKNPRNVGDMKDPDGKATIKSPTSNDLFNIYLKIKDDKIIDIKFKTFGCAAAIASSSILTEMAKGKSIDESLNITRRDIADRLEGLPPSKMECSTYAADALHKAIKDYLTKKKL